VGLVVHGGRNDARVAAADAAKLLRDTGTTPIGLVTDGWEDEAMELREPGSFCEDMRLVLVFGGDGTFLRAAYLARDAGVPLLGVNLGRLGFLSEVEAADVPVAIERVVRGDFDVEERMTLAVQVRGPQGDLTGASWALNEASVERTVPQRLIVLEVRVGETVFANVPADAIICATPTGSTAYAFSARGPILSPLVDAILLVPVAPHSLFDRTLVIDPAESLALQPVGGDGCVVSLDGRETLPVPAGGTVTVSRGERPVRLARLGPFDFYQRVRKKFGLQ
jgi:NAD+ kinase